MSVICTTTDTNTCFVEPRREPRREPMSTKASSFKFIAYHVTGTHTHTTAKNAVDYKKTQRYALAE